MDENKGSRKLGEEMQIGWEDARERRRMLYIRT